MTRVSIKVVAAAVVFLMTMTVPSWGGGDDWRILDIKGKVVLTPSHGGERKEIFNEKYLLAPLQVGDRLQVEERGRIVIVSRSSRQSFELGEKSEAVVEAEELRVVKGEVVIKEGFSLPRSNEGRIGGVVMRGVRSAKGCLKAISPVDTAILDNEPFLKWENTCSDLGEVDITLVSGEKILFSTTTGGSELKLPAETIKPGQRYMWLIDGGGDYSLASGAFNTLNEDERAEVVNRIARARTTDDDIAAKVALAFYLGEKGLFDQARQESRAIRLRFPAAAGLDLLP